MYKTHRYIKSVGCLLVDEDQRGMLFGGGLIIKSPVKFIQYLDFKAFIKFYLDIIETYSCNTTDEYLRSIDEILLMFLCFTHALKQPFVFNAPITLVYNSCWERYTVSRGQSVISSPYYEQSYSRCNIETLPKLDWIKISQL